MKQKLLKILFMNCLIPACLAISAIMELTAVTVTGGYFFIRNPWIYVSLLLIFGAVMFSIRNQSGRFWFGFVLLLANFVIDIVFIVVYEMTDTIFDFSMLNLRSDAMAIIESLPINFWYVLVSGSLISAYIILGRYYVKRAPKPAKPAKIPVIITASVMACILALHGILVFFSHHNYNAGNMSDKLYRNNTSSYADKGILGNFVGELYKGAFFSGVELGDTAELDDFVYSSVYEGSDMFGKAQGYNVITVLGESFEWFGFMNSFPGSDERFPGGFNADEQVLRELYPNLYKLYDSSFAATNFHSREKTDMSENLSIMGAYPTDKIINYDYPKNTVVTSLARTMKNLDGDEAVTANYFHNGTSSFYNRSEYLARGLGFDSFTASDKMNDLGMPDYISKGERNLDSEMVDTCYAEMFPTDKRFYTYITTITQHGQYEPRDNLGKYYDKLDEYGLAALPKKSDSSYESVRNFRTYAAAAMELDAAIGAIDKYLTERGLMDSTILVLFGDHNAYYSSLSSDVKGIDDGKYDTERNYTDLYRVPLMIRVGSGEDEKPRRIDKFTCTADILPSLYDLLGIKTYSSLLYGTSVFDERESVLYSRAYDIFLTDKVYFSSLNKIRYQSAEADAEYMKTVEKTSLTLMEKVSHTNRIFYYDYFAGNKAKEYYAKLRALNGV